MLDGQPSLAPHIARAGPLWARLSHVDRCRTGPSLKSREEIRDKRATVSNGATARGTRRGQVPWRAKARTPRLPCARRPPRACSTCLTGDQSVPCYKVHCSLYPPCVRREPQPTTAGTRGNPHLIDASLANGEAPRLEPMQSRPRRSAATEPRKEECSRKKPSMYCLSRSGRGGHARHVQYLRSTHSRVFRRRQPTSSRAVVATCRYPAWRFDLVFGVASRPGHYPSEKSLW